MQSGDTLEDQLYSVCRKHKLYIEETEKVQKEYKKLKAQIPKELEESLIAMCDAQADTEQAASLICYQKGFKDAIKFILNTVS